MFVLLDFNVVQEIDKNQFLDVNVFRGAGRENILPLLCGSKTKMIVTRKESGKL